MSSQLSEFEGEPAKPVDKEELENDDEDDGRRRMHAKEYWQNCKIYERD